jgi:hypothetical protein
MKELPGEAYWRHGQPLFSPPSGSRGGSSFRRGRGLSKTMSYLSIVSSATVKISATSLVKGSHPGGWSRKWVDEAEL